MHLAVTAVVGNHIPGYIQSANAPSCAACQKAFLTSRWVVYISFPIAVFLLPVSGSLNISPIAFGFNAPQYWLWYCSS